MIPARKFHDHIVVPALRAMGETRRAACVLVTATALAESQLRAVRQFGGPALGLCQMEPATHDDTWLWLAARQRPQLLAGLREFSLRPGKAAELETNPFYSAQMCRIYYMRFPEALPDPCDREAVARYWKTYYNTAAGKGTVEGFLEKAQGAFDV